VLYTHYFAWAFVSLIVLLIMRVFRRIRALQAAALSLGAAALATINVQGIAALIRFGLDHYPLG
jgi:predicted exporter